MTQRVPLRRRLFIVVVAAVVPLAMMSGIALYSGYERQRAQAEQSGLDVARALHTAVGAELQRTISVLSVLGDTRAIEPFDAQWFDERTRQALTAQPSWSAITLADTRGRVVFDTRQPSDLAPRVGSEPESVYQVLATEKPVVGYLSRDAGGYSFAVRVPVMHQGTLHYVLSAIVNPNAILAVLNSQQVPGGWIVAVGDGKGRRVARTRSAEQSLGTPFSPTLIEMMQRQGSEGKGTTLTTEGEPVFTAYTRTGPFGWTTAVGLPTKEIEAAARESFLALGAGIALSTLLGILAALFMARRIVRPIAALREAAIDMGRGERFRAPETDLQEIHDVSTTLATAAQEQARARAEREELLTREQEARAIAEASNRAKDEFLAMLGHELRNPLAAISNAATVLGDERLDAKAALRSRAVIVRQVTHLAQLTDDLLDAGRALMGKIVLRTHPLDLAAAALQSLATLKSANRIGNHRIVEDFETAWIEADPVRLDQIIGNLVVNAAKYTPEGGTIRVSVRRQDGEAILRIADDGIGIEPALLPHVFDLFVQGTRDLDRSEGGLGIGLTLVRRLTELHGGRVGVRSDGTGKGSEFTVAFPAAEPPADSSATASRVPAGRPRDILVIEDNADARETLKMLLELSGHRVETAADGAIGLEKAFALQPDVALIDVGLPEIDGYEVARRIRASHGMRRPFLIALTGYGSPEDRQRALDAGFDAHVVKPVDHDVLVAILASPESAIAS